MYIGVVDGQGGGVGRAIVTELKTRFPSHRVVALGTNAMATGSMLRAGADEGATGENAIIHTAPRCDLILGPVGIVLANAMLGELSPAMALAIGGCDAIKVLIPMPQAHLRIAGYEDRPLGQLIALAMDQVQAICGSDQA